MALRYDLEQRKALWLTKYLHSRLSYTKARGLKGLTSKEIQEPF